jgi:hypothetical protein
VAVAHKPENKMTYNWKNNPACVATYNVLEGDNFLDQFEDVDFPFSEAGAVKLENLRYYPKTTANANILEVLALNMSRDFLRYIVKTYTVSKENKAESSAEIIDALATIFKDGSKTVADLAEATDRHVKFPMEGNA